MARNIYVDSPENRIGSVYMRQVEDARLLGFRVLSSEVITNRARARRRGIKILRSTVYPNAYEITVHPDKDSHENSEDGKPDEEGPKVADVELVDSFLTEDEPDDNHDDVEDERLVRSE